MPKTLSEMMSNRVIPAPIRLNPDALEPQPKLNSKLWNTETNEMRQDVYNAILELSGDFVQRLDLKPSDIDDIRIVGGNAGYSYNDASDIDVTLMLSRDLGLTKEDVRRLAIAANGLNYRLHPRLNGIDLNFYPSTRNIGGLRPAKQNIFSFKDGWIKGPTKYHETENNHLAGKANYIAELIEEVLTDDDSEADERAVELFDRLKKYRVAGLKSRQGEESTANLVWRLLTASGYIKTLKDKVGQVEKEYYNVKTPHLIRNEEYRALAKSGSGMNTIPHSIIRLSTLISRGQNPMPIIRRVKPILDLFEDIYEVGYKAGKCAKCGCDDHATQDCTK